MLYIVVPHFTVPSINNPLLMGLIVCINDMFTFSHSHQFWSIRMPLSEISRPQPISDTHIQTFGTFQLLIIPPPPSPPERGQASTSNDPSIFILCFVDRCFMLYLVIIYPYFYIFDVSVRSYNIYVWTFYV